MTRVQILYNPTSGRYSPLVVSRLAAAFRARGAEVIASETGRTPPAILPDIDHVCVVGGDGTLRHVALALAAIPDAPPLSAFPGGTVNLLAREWAGGACVDTFAARVLVRTRRMHFPVRLDGAGLFLVCAGAGWESAAVARVSPAMKRWTGRFAYAVSAIACLGRWQAPCITLVADGRRITCGGFHIAKGVHYGGPWRLASRAFGHEPLMEVVALTAARRRDLLRFWWTLARGRSIAALPGVVVVECATLDVTADTPWPVQADGDLVGTLPMRFRIAADPIGLC